jgi:HSP20 family protein
MNHELTRRRNGREEIANLGALEPLRAMWALLGGDPAREFERVLRWEEERAFMPRFDVKETAQAYVFKADIPGIPESDIEISVVGNRLTVTGKREVEQKAEGENYVAAERSYGSFTRTFQLPEGADGDNIAAQMKEGVLTVTVPKRPEVHPKKIPLKTDSGAGTKS